MDTKKLFTWMMVATLVMFGYLYFFGPKPKAENGAAGGAGAGTAAVSGAGGATTSAAAVADAGEFAAPETRPLGKCENDAKYRLALEVDNQTAGINWVRLNSRDYTETAKDKKPFVLLWTNPGELRAFATKAITINGNRVDMLARPGDGQPVTWKYVESGSPDVVRMRFVIEAAGKPYVQIDKVFKIEDPANYDVTVTHEVTNFSGAAMTVSIEQYGPTSLPFDDVRSDPRNYQGAVYRSGTKVLDSEKGPIVLQAVFNGKERPAYKELGDFAATPDPLVWVAASDRFFTAIVRPLPGVTYTKYVLDDKREIPAVDFLGAAQVDRLDDQRVAVHFFGRPVTVAPGGTEPTKLAETVFFGPKKRHLLEGEWAQVPKTPANYYEEYKYIGVIHLAQGGMCAFCTFTWIANGILWALDWLNVVTHNYGVAIIILVIVVRLLLHPLTRYSQVNMAKMQKKMADFQPEMDRLKKKYAKDKGQLNTEMMKLYKEKKINPAGGIAGCLPMFIQMPIWIALYAALAIDIDLRHAGFIPGWINDLSNPDTVLKFSEPVNIVIMQLNGINLLPLLLMVVFFFQMKLQMRNMPTPADDQQAQTQKMTQYMTLLFPIFLYNAPSGLNLYIFASTIGGLFDSWLVRRHLKAEGLVVVRK